MELREEYGGNTKGSRDCHLCVLKCMARVCETPRPFPQSPQTSAVRPQKNQKQARDKNGRGGCEKGEKRVELATLQEGLFSFIKYPSMPLR